MTVSSVNRQTTSGAAPLNHIPAPYNKYSSEVAAASKKYGIPQEVLYGVMMRETNGQNIIGDAGHGHGLMQIDDRSHGAWLASHDNGMDPASNIDYAASILKSSMDAFGGDLTKGLAAYNAGVGGVQNALREGRSPDSATTGGDYASAVLANAKRFGNGSISSAGPGTVGGSQGPGESSGGFSLKGPKMGGDVSTHSLLKLGSQGKEVKQLQSFLQKQGFLHGDANGKFDAATDAAVKAYQSAAGLQVDGEVGQQTWGSFMGKSYPPGVSMLRNGGTPGYSTQDIYNRPDGTSSASDSVQGGNVSGKGSEKLAEAGRAAAMGMGGYTSGGLCATGVSRAIESAYGIHVSGNGNQIDDNLPRDKFKQVNMPLSEALKIPGMVLTWEHTSTAAGSIYGHTAITLGDGHSSASDFIERDTLAGAQSRTGLKIFMPIS